MSENSFRLKRGDTKPVLVASISERDPLFPGDFTRRRPLDLSLALGVRLLAKTRDGRRSIAQPVDIVAADPDDPVWDEHPELTPFPYKIQYSWQEEDTQYPATFYAEFEINFQDGSFQTVPARGNFLIVVEDDKG